MEIAKLFEYLPANIKSQIDWKRIGTDDDEAKVQVFCPFHDDNRKSAVLFYKRGNLYCSACDKNYELIEFIKDSYYLKSTNDISKIKTCVREDTTLTDWLEKSKLFMEEHFVNTDLVGKGFTYKACAEVNLIGEMGDKNDLAYFHIPVIINGYLQDVRSYYPGQNPKWKSQYKANTGLIVPYDLWMKEPIHKPTYICAGEKDMLIARSRNLNAICITGGENTLPIQPLAFKGRECYILYDNDDAGRKGGLKLASYLLDCGAIVKNVTNFHELLKDKEDIYDFFVKYKNSVSKLDHYIATTPLFEKPFTLENNSKEYKTVNILEVFKDENDTLAYKKFKTQLQCLGADIERYTCPIKFMLVQRETKAELDFDLNFEDEPQAIVDLLNNISATKDPVSAIIKTFKVRKDSYELKIEKEHSFYFGSVRSLEGSVDITSLPEIEYISNTFLESSKIYDVKYMPIKNNGKGRATMLAINDASNKNDYSITINANTEALLKQFSVENKIHYSDANAFSNSVISHQKKIDELFNRACDDMFLTKRADRNIWEFFELVFCSPLQFIYNNNIYRAAIHACAIGDSQIGKSWTLERMINIYGHGKKLNAKTSTITALVGGADKNKNGSYRIKAGELVFNHRGLLGIEEIHGNKEYYTKITEVKSSGKVQITRVAGTANFDCLLRLIEIANPDQRATVKSYANGFKLINELITQPEDIGRVDLFGIFSNEHYISGETNAYANTMFNKLAYESRTRWIWSRKPNEIEFSFNEAHLKKLCEKINDRFINEVPMFGGVNTELRILRLACAYAGMLVSTNATFDKLVVKNEHITLAYEYFNRMYSSECYLFDEVSNEYRLGLGKSNDDLVDDLKAFNQLLPDMKNALSTFVSNSIDNTNIIKDRLGSEGLSSFLKLLEDNYWATRNQAKIKPTRRLVNLIKYAKKNGLFNGTKPDYTDDD